MKNIIVILILMVWLIGCTSIPTSFKKAELWHMGHDINNPVLYFRMLKLESEAEFTARVMDEIKDTDYIRIRLIYGDSLNCQGLPGGEGLRAIAVYYPKKEK